VREFLLSLSLSCFSGREKRLLSAQPSPDPGLLLLPLFGRTDGRAQRGAPKIRLVSTRSARRHRVAVGDIRAESRTRRRSLSVTVVCALAAVVARNDPPSSGSKVRGAPVTASRGAIPLFSSLSYLGDESDRGRYVIRGEAKSHPAAIRGFGKICILCEVRLPMLPKDEAKRRKRSIPRFVPFLCSYASLPSRPSSPPLSNIRVEIRVDTSLCEVRCRGKTE